MAEAFSADCITDVEFFRQSCFPSERQAIQPRLIYHTATFPPSPKSFNIVATLFIVVVLMFLIATACFTVSAW